MHVDSLSLSFTLSFRFEQTQQPQSKTQHGPTAFQLLLQRCHLKPQASWLERATNHLLHLVWLVSVGRDVTPGELHMAVWFFSITVWHCSALQKLLSQDCCMHMWHNCPWSVTTSFFSEQKKHQSTLQMIIWARSSAGIKPSSYLRHFQVPIPTMSEHLTSLNAVLLMTALGGSKVLPCPLYRWGTEAQSLAQGHAGSLCGAGS